MIKTKDDCFQILTVIFISCLLISNILASKIFTFGSIELPSAVIIFPIVYIVNDLFAEIYGYEKTKKIIYLGFLVNLMAVTVYNIALLLPSPLYATETAQAFGIVLGSTTRTLIASFLAYIFGSLANAKIMTILKEKSENRLFYRCISSTLVGEGIDATIFITIVFLGVIEFKQLVLMIIAQAMFKTIFEVFMFPITRLVIKYARKLK